LGESEAVATLEDHMAAIETLGFVGLGTMGEPMCANLARKSGRPVHAVDRRAEPLARLAAEKVIACASVTELARCADIVFLSLPSGREVEEVCLGPGGIAGAGGRVRTVIDCGTSPVALTRALAARLAEAGIDFVDAPVARTREAAQQGRLSIMVGGSAALFGRINPFLAAMGTDITHCGPVGSGQVVKILNNMVLFETVGALAEALVIGGRAGVDGLLLLEALGKGSADSFALRNHGMKAMLPGHFPENAFCAEYALKDLLYALELARAGGVGAAGAEVARERLAEAIRRGDGQKYWPVLLDVVAGED
jgi:3-hydroxyisobutyrate dehydrogenase-like beta-hydroxyacid dehydrogenase